MKRYGWFEYGETPIEITNYLTGQRLAVISGYSLTPNLDLKCVYSDAELQQPVHISIFRENCSSGGRIEMDYGDVFSVPPAYSHWRRLDDFLLDALSCWPEFVLNALWGSLIITGGWRSGCWEPKLKRLFLAGKSKTPEQLKNYPIAEPYVYPLDKTTPGRWRYSDVELPAVKAELMFERDAPLFIPYLSAKAPICGFQGSVPFLEREDKGAYLFPAKLEPASDRGEDPMTYLWYTYVDENVFFTFRTTPWQNVELFYCKDYGFRRFPPEKEFWVTDAMGNLIPGNTPRNPENIHARSSYLSYRAWLQVMTSINDAWPMWRNPPRKMEIDASVILRKYYGRTAYVGEYGSAIRYGFSAGMRNTDFRLQFKNK
jgi:hypothetical protein